jgi:hypothetical protein
VAFVAAHPEKTVLEAAALQVGIRLPASMSIMRSETPLFSRKRTER